MDLPLMRKEVYGLRSDDTEIPVEIGMKLLPHFQVFSPNNHQRLGHKPLHHRVDVHTEVEHNPFYVNKSTFLKNDDYCDLF